MMFDAFARAHGLIVDGGIVPGRWMRVPTVDHPRSDNGAYKFLGDVGWVQNWATMPEPVTWKPERHEVQGVDVERIKRDAARHQQRVRDGWAKAGSRAAALIDAAKPGEHAYLECKGFADEMGLVGADGALIVPMRHWRSNALVGAQIIVWDGEAMKYDKRMLPGMRARGAVFRLGPQRAARTWLVEGYATGLSVLAALGLMKLRDSVLVCFSAGNLVAVARDMGLHGLCCFADNDASGAGERAARDAGIRWVMSPVVGEDANDMHKRAGIFQVAALMRQVLRE
jgi:putative DNA primase/helicase